MPYVPKQYASAKRFITQYTDLGNIVDPNDKARCAAYSLYDDFYRNRPETFEVTLRESTDTEIYIPSSKKIVNSTAMYLAVKPELQAKGGNAAAVKALFEDIWAREELGRKFVRAKKDNLAMGDYIWYITADPRKADREKISINVVHPSSYFPIYDPEDETRVTGCYLVDLVPDPRPGSSKGDQVARRQDYYKTPEGIISQCQTFEIGRWDERYLDPDDIRRVSIVVEPFLIQGIKQLPLYHIPIDAPTGSSWGTSILSGIEYVINAMNQSITYEDLTLVLQGLGVYVTTAGPPVDPVTKKPMKYRMHPGSVLEMSQGDEFERVTGVSSVSPFQDHIQLLNDWSLAGTGLSDIATGNVDVAVAESGIALAFKMGPILAENGDRELEIKARWDQMVYDLVHHWFPTFEGIQPGDGLKVELIFGDPMPINREAEVTEVTTLADGGYILLDEVRDRLEKLGYEKKPNIVEDLLSEQEKKTKTLNPDPFPQESASGTMGDTVSSGI